MEKPVKLKHEKVSTKGSKTDATGRVCIVHLEDTFGEKVGGLTDTGFKKIQEVARTRLKFGSQKDRLEDIISNIPDILESSKHGTHRRCYQSFTNISRLAKRKSKCDDVPSSSKKQRRSFDPLGNPLLFPADKCLFCDKETIKVKGTKQKLTKCVTKCAEESIKLAVANKGDEALSCKIQTQDLVAREAWYHNVCRRKYTRSEARHVSHEGSESSQSEAAHKQAFEFISSYIEKNIIEGQNVERLTMLRERYLEYLLEKFPDEYNENYKTYKLKNKLVKHFKDRLNFWRPERSKTTSELVYGTNVEGNAIEKAFELASSDERRLQESAMILRRYMFDERKSSSQMPWPPSSDWLLSGERKAPDILVNFTVQLISGKSENRISPKTRRIASSISEDICYAASNGEWVMPKHVLLPMTVRHLTGNAELVTILNRFGHAQSYTRTMELETAMCNSIITSESILPANISVENNAVLHLCWDNFDLNEETPSGCGTTHSTHGIIIQEVVNGITTAASENQLAKSGERTVKPKAVDIKPCYAKPKFEPTLQIGTRGPAYCFRTTNLSSFAWFLCRVVGSMLEAQTVPSYSGWLSSTAGEKVENKSVVEYMPPLNVSINERSTVQHILETSLAASKEAGQTYAIVTFDLAVAKIAYALVWQYPEKFSQVIVRMGVFHTICSLFGTVGKMMKGSGFAEIVIEAGICASGSLEKVMSGKHYNRALRVHKLFAEGLERLLLECFDNIQNEDSIIPVNVQTLLENLANDQSKDNLDKCLECDQFLTYFERYQVFKDSIRGGNMGKTARFWLQYMDAVFKILTLIKATKENDLDLHIAALYDLCPMFFAFDHSNYARYVPAYLMTMLNLPDTHPGAKDLLQHNGFSVSRSHVPKCRNPVDITIEQTINKHAKCQGGIVGFSRNYSAYYRWCSTRHCRAKYVEAVLELTDMLSEESSLHKDLRRSQMAESESDVKKVMNAICSFTNPFDTGRSTEHLYCLSSGVPAKPDVAEDLLNAASIGETSMTEFLQNRLIDRTVEFHSPIKRNKLKTFVTAEVKKTVKSSKNKITQIKAERNIFAQLILLTVEHDIDLEVTLSYPLGPVPWSLATADGMPVKTDKAKLLHYIESSIEPLTTRPKGDIVHIVDGNAILQSLVSIPDNFEDLAETVFNHLPKSGRVDFVTDTYKATSIKSFERTRRGSTPTFLLSGPKTRTPKDWKGFMGNDDNKTQLLQLLFDQWKTEKYAKALEGRFVYYVLGEMCYRLTSHDGEIVDVFPDNALFSSQEEADTRIILHCMHIRDTEPDKTTILVRSPDTDVMVLLMKYSRQISRPVLFDTGVGNRRRLLSVDDIVHQKGENICAILPAFHCLTGCDTTSAFVRRGKVSPLKLVEKNPDFVEILGKLGQEHACSSELQTGIERFICAVYGKPSYTDINKLRHDTFCKKNQSHGNILDSYNSIDMSLLPPCRDSLQMHILRANYQSYIWLHADEKLPVLPDLDESGWKVGAEGIEYVWTKGEIVPQELIDILCTSSDEKEHDSDGNEDEDEVEMDNLIDEIFDEDGDNDIE